MMPVILSPRQGNGMFILGFAAGLTVAAPWVRTVSAGLAWTIIGLAALIGIVGFSIRWASPRRAAVHP